MIVHVAARASESGVGRVVVATDAPAVFDAVQRARLRGRDDAMPITNPAPTASSRRCSARSGRRGRYDRQRAGRSADHRAGHHPRRARLRSRRRRSTSRRSASRSSARRKRPTPTSSRSSARRSAAAGCARSISRAPPRRAGEGPLYHHIGLYAYRRAALERFVSLAPSSLERREKLEQLRALEAGMRIDAEIVALGAARRRHAGRPRTRPHNASRQMNSRT